MVKSRNTDIEKKFRLLGMLGDLSQAKVRASEFRYSKGTAIFEEAKPADYIYQVIEGRGSEPQAVI